MGHPNPNEEEDDNDPEVECFLLGSSVEIIGCAAVIPDEDPDEKLPTLAFKIEMDNTTRIIQLSFRSSQSMMKFHKAVAMMTLAMIYPDSTEEKTGGILGL